MFIFRKFHFVPECVNRKKEFQRKTILVVPENTFVPKLCKFCIIKHPGDKAFLEKHKVC